MSHQEFIKIFLPSEENMIEGMSGAGTAVLAYIGLSNVLTHEIFKIVAACLTGFIGGFFGVLAKRLYDLLERKIITLYTTLKLIFNKKQKI